MNDVTGPVTVTGNMASAMTISGGNEFKSSLDARDVSNLVGGDIGRNVGSAISLGRNVANLTRGSDIVFVGETESVWGGSRTPVFELDISFLCLSTSPALANANDITTKVNNLMRGVYPNISGTGRLSKTFKAPLGYTRNDTNQGKATLLIGNWFRADKLIFDSVSFTYSKEINRLGKPIYANGRVTLKPYRGISYREFSRYFLNGGAA